VTTRAADGTWLFRDDHDYLRFETEVERILSPDCTCVAACALGTHYHLLLDVEDGVLPNVLRLLNSRYAGVYKARYGRRGHVYAERYTSILVESDEHLLTVFRYVVRNPVHAGLCERAEDWPWSSYRCAIGLEGRFSFCDPSLVVAVCDGSIEQLRSLCETPWESDRTAGPGPAVAGPGPWATRTAR
jgi:REP element-mobilizing transposase RayT